MNTTNLIGRLTRENEIRYSQSGTAVLRNTIAVNRKFKREEADFINILAFSKGAELIANHFNKGDEIAIEGHIQTGSYEKDGRKIYTTEVVVDNITFTNGKKSGNQSNNQPADKSNYDPFDKNGKLKSEPMNLDESELPF
jgi:single-strand DNA-binding protein